MLNMEDIKNAMNTKQEIYYPIPELLEDRYRLILSLSADIRYGSIYQDLEPDKLMQEVEHLKRLKESLGSEEEYENWKSQYMAEEYERIRDVPLVVCEYAYKGAGEYSAVIPGFAEPSFLMWAENNMSVVHKGTREAQKEEYLRYIALNAVKQERD